MDEEERCKRIMERVFKRAELMMDTIAVAKGHHYIGSFIVLLHGPRPEGDATEAIVAANVLCDLATGYGNYDGNALDKVVADAVNAYLQRDRPPRSN